MIGNFLKRMEEKSRNPENVVKLREAHELLDEQGKALAEKDDLIEQQKQEIEKLKERLGTNGQEC